MSDLPPDLFWSVVVSFAIIAITVLWLLIETESKKAQSEVDKMKREHEKRLKRMMQNDR